MLQLQQLRLVGRCASAAALWPQAGPAAVLLERRQSSTLLSAAGRRQWPSAVRLRQPLRFHGGHHHHHHHNQHSSATLGNTASTAESQGNAIDSLLKGERGVVLVTKLGLWINLAMSGAKAAVGVLCNSPALLADAVHSATDLISDFITLLTLKKARTPISSSHPYGQGKWEAIGALSCAALLVGSAGGLCWHAGQVLLASLAQAGHLPGWLPFDTAAASQQHASDEQLPLEWALGVGVASIACKEWLYQMTMRVGLANHSQVVVANAWHHRSDSLSSVVVVLGIGAGLLCDLPYLDAAAGLVVAAMIGKAGYDVGRDSLVSLTDANVDPEIIESLRDAIRQSPDVKGYHKLRARRSGPSYFVDVHIEVDPKLSISAAHQICHQVERHIFNGNDRVSEVIVHPDPVETAHSSSSSSSSPDAASAGVSSAPASSLSWYEEPHHSPDHFPHISRPIVEIEAECRSLVSATLSQSVEAITHMTVHYLSGSVSLQIVFVPVNKAMSIADAARLGDEIRRTLVDAVPDVDHVDVLIDTSALVKNR